MTARIARAGGKVELAAGLVGMGYCVATNEEGLTLFGFITVFASFGGLGLLSGLVLCDLAEHLGRRKRWMFILLAVVAGVHGAALLGLGIRLLPNYHSLPRRRFADIVLYFSLLLPLVGLVVMDGFLLVCAAEAARHLPKRRRRGRAFRPALRVLPLDDGTDTDATTSPRPPASEGGGPAVQRLRGGGSDGAGNSLNS